MDYYDDSEPMAEEASTQGEGGKESDTKTALIDSSICPDMPVGSKIELTIQKVLDSGEYVVSYDKGSEKEESTEEPPMEESMAPQSEVASYME